VAPGGKSKKTVKTSTSRRRVPVHPELLKMGFLAYIDEQNAKVEPRVFASLKPNKFGNLAWYALKRFNEVFLKDAIITEERQAFYSFRHSFRDALRRAKADHDVLQALGWGQGSHVSDDYGNRSDPDLMAKFMPEITFPGLDLSPLYVKETPA